MRACFISGQESMEKLNPTPTLCVCKCVCSHSKVKTKKKKRKVRGLEKTIEKSKGKKN